VLSCGKSAGYKEWKAPLSSRHYSRDGRRVFIEAIADDTFEIHTTITPSFDWAMHEHLLVRYKLDGFIIRKKMISKRNLELHAYRIPLTKDICKSCSILINGSRQLCSLAFESSQLGDLMDLS
jgi:hypothetical protein